MSICIYKINFNNTDKVYIGQTIDFNSRMYHHSSKLQQGKSPPKLQEAYDTYGVRSYEILIECTTEELNSLEAAAIDVYDSVNNGFNTNSEPGPPLLYGELTGQAKQSNSKYLEVLALLVQENPTLSKREISCLTGVSLYTVRHIAALESHQWMKEADPVNYAKLEHIKHNKKYFYGTQYPTIVSPTGVEYNVEHVTNFAKEHGLLQPKLTEVLRGTRNTHKGWRLA